MDKAWKRAERNTAKSLGGVRNPLSRPADVLHPDLFIEVKYRKRFSILSMMKKVEGKAKNKIPVLVLQQANAKRRYVLVREEDWKGIP